jgi:MFS family permease
MDSIQVETTNSGVTQITQIAVATHTLSSTPKSHTSSISKDAIRTSLRASTIDGIFAAVFSITTTGILLSNFLVELDASPVYFGILSSIPMLVNLIQPLGAFLSERSDSRFHYSIWTYGISRLLWIILVIGIFSDHWGNIDFNSHQLVILTLVIVLAGSLSGGLGSASWLSWLAILVPRRLRGRYFGIRNSAASLTNLICVPLGGLAVSSWPGGAVEGYGVVLLLGIIAGLISLCCQYFKVDINPHTQDALIAKYSGKKTVSFAEGVSNTSPEISIWKNANFWMFLLYFSFWMFAFHLSNPFFNLYMLDNLNIDIRWVTVYGSIQAGANLLMLILWGKLADRIGSRPILIFVGILVAVIPLLWLAIGTNPLSLWLLLPLLHILIGGTVAATDLCNNNMQIGISPVKNQSIYFAIAAAVAGLSGALGTTLGGFIVQFASFGGLLGLFTISSLLRILSLIPLVFVKEPRN